MKKEKAKKKKESKNGGEVGLLYSPIVKNLISLLPILILVGVGSGIFLAKGETKLGEEVIASPTDPLPHLRLAEAAAESGDRDLAITEYELALELMKGQDSPTLGLTTELEDKIWPEKKIEREISYWEEVLTTSPSRQIYLRLAELYLELGDKERARNYWEEARRIDPNDPSVVEAGERF